MATQARPSGTTRARIRPMMLLLAMLSLFVPILVHAQDPAVQQHGQVDLSVLQTPTQISHSAFTSTLHGHNDPGELTIQRQQPTTGSRVRKMFQDLAHALLHPEDAPCRTVLRSKRDSSGEHDQEQPLEKRLAVPVKANTTTTTAGRPPAPAVTTHASTRPPVAHTTPTVAHVTHATPAVVPTAPNTASKPPPKSPTTGAPRTVVPATSQPASTPPNNAQPANTNLNPTVNPAAAPPASSGANGATGTPANTNNGANANLNSAVTVVTAQPAGVGVTTTSSGSTSSDPAAAPAAAVPASAADAPASAPASGTSGNTATSANVPGVVLPTLTVASGNTAPINAQNLTASGSGSGSNTDGTTTGKEGVISATTTTGSDGTVTEVDAFAYSPVGIPVRPKTSTVEIDEPNGTGPPIRRTSQIVIWIATQTHPAGAGGTSYIDIPANETNHNGTGRSPRLQSGGARSALLDAGTVTVLAIGVALAVLFGSSLVL